MGRITPSFRQLYEETIAELRSELQSAMVDLGHKGAFDLILKDAWNREQAAMGNSTLPTVCDKLNLVASIHNRKLTAAMSRELKEKDVKIRELSDRVVELENTIKMILDRLRADDDNNNPGPINGQ
ncbi:MAG TPA: hypothetical protein VE130_10410 [Nitrososphaeraceae archaeon]|nr:hypothetical protein [Nitrososphaeraceae archaeon]